ncbi:putative ATP-dependent helicase DinG [Maioricimonas rarisocia]|uniref:DNA 5'-3' helicase n=1 Tax=Maioricimonas rarisocia TaxID=2528026 RepID=A0A517ZEW9_9PLAN|nr:helicase C-terminal domain-containing protein [Maioricimonas rarisocia]QDU40979.1 putative ATP-dependent helicase DinG [Maioricimonas rarisocia]
MDLTPEDVLGDGGLISRRLSSYESRPEQLAMANAVAAAIDAGEHLVVEAGTGVGKSFAYLVPALLAATARQSEEGKGKKVVVSTHTISLQEQLIARDIPFLNSVLPVEFSAVLVKGRSNYISIRRVKAAAERSNSIFGETEELRQLKKLRSWASSTGDGSLAELDFRPLPQVWDEVRSEHGNCLGRKCPTHSDCHYYRARRRVWNADVLVVNHALFFSDLALRREGANILPDYDVVIFDEAHTLEDVAADHLGLSVTSGQFTFMFNKLYNDRQQKGLLLFHNLVEAQKLIMRLRYLVDEFFEQVLQWREEYGGTNGRLREPLKIDTPLPAELQTLAGMLRMHVPKVRAEEQKIELTAAADRMDGLAQSLKGWLRQTLDDGVYWIETTGGRRPNTKLVCSPVEIGPALRDHLFNEVGTAVLTSATLSVGQNDFRYFRSRIGLTESREEQQGSPFDYQQQARLVLAREMPDPSTQPREFEAAACERIRHYIAQSEGGTFVLFTSYRMLKACADQLTPWFTRQNMKLLCHGSGMQRTQLLEQFRKHDRAVLFGTDSFWQGVDVPGDALRNVIITKIPFSVPDHPLLEARVERIRQRGGNPFMEYQVPEAAIKLRQGFGRLIRTRTDTGQVVILDPRMLTKQYGRIFRDSLPDCRVVIEGAPQTTRHDHEY